MITKEQVEEKLQTVEDPELGVDVHSLGLIYNIEVTEKECSILMTFTSPQCPFGPYMVQDIKKAVGTLGFDSVKVEITFEPRWSPTDELKAALGIGTM